MSLLTRALRGDATRPSALTVVQWNVLADALAHKGFVHATPDCLAWTVRGQRILDLLDDGLPEPADVICLQEVDDYPRLEDALSARDYVGRFEPKAEGRDGCCLFVRRSRFALEEVRPLRYLHGDGTPMTQLALIARLAPQGGGEPVWVATTHLKAKPGNEAIRAEQVRQLLDALPTDAPRVVAGDFNDVPGSPAHEIMAASLRSASETLTGVELPWTTWKVRAGGEVKRTIDYVWHSPELRPLACLDVPGDEDVGPQALPSDRYPSDHLSLAVRFERSA